MKTNSISKILTLPKQIHFDKALRLFVCPLCHQTHLVLCLVRSEKSGIRSIDVLRVSKMQVSHHMKLY